MTIGISGIAQTGDFTSTVPVNLGGTGATTFTNNGLLYGQGASAIGATAAVAAGQIVIGASPHPRPRTVLGDGTLAANGTLSVSKTGGVAFAASATVNALNLDNATGGTLPEARGGTGETSYTQSQLLIGNALGKLDKKLLSEIFLQGSNTTLTFGAETVTVNSAGGGGGGSVSLANNTFAANISGGTADAIAVSWSDSTDAMLSNTRGAEPFRGSGGWGAGLIGGQGPLTISWIAGVDPGGTRGLTLFVAHQACRVRGIKGVPDVAEGAVATVQLVKAPSGTPLASGTALHTGTFDANGTVDTDQTLTLSVTASDLVLAAGDRIGLITAGSWTTSEGSITVQVSRN